MINANISSLSPVRLTEKMIKLENNHRNCQPGSGRWCCPANNSTSDKVRPHHYIKMTNYLNWHLTHNKKNNILTHNMIVVLSSDGVRQLGLVSDIIGVSVYVD